MGRVWAAELKLQMENPPTGPFYANVWEKFAANSWSLHIEPCYQEVDRFENASICFLATEADRLLRPGARFDLCHGTQIIGTVRVIRPSWSGPMSHADLSTMLPVTKEVEKVANESWARTRLETLAEIREALHRIYMSTTMPDRLTALEKALAEIDKRIV